MTRKSAATAKGSKEDRAWPALNLERMALRDLAPYQNNPRSHTDHQIAQLAASIREWGWTLPILVDEEGTILAGHARVMAASVLGIASVPVAIARGWTPAQKRAYVIADNRLTESGNWSEEGLRIELNDLLVSGFDFTLTGFTHDELDILSRERMSEAESRAGQQVATGERILLMVDCKTEEIREELFNILTERGITCKIMD